MKIISIAAVTAGGKTTVVNKLKENIDTAIFIDTPLDVALARRILRDLENASGEEIRND